MNYADLNEFETKILNEILNAIKEKGYSPTVREIRSATNIKSTSTVQKYLNSLMKKGYITKDDNKNRTIEIVNKQLFESDYCENTSNEKTIDVPLLGDVAAGIPIFAEQNIEEMVPLPAYLSKRGNLFILKLRGDSMINMGILEGDKIIVRQQSDADNGDVVVALVDEDYATVKKFYKKPEHIELRPENDYMNPIISKNVKVLGKVIGLYRSI